MIREIKKEEIAELIQKVDELGRYLTNHPEVSGEDKRYVNSYTKYIKKKDMRWRACPNRPETKITYSKYITL